MGCWFKNVGAHFIPVQSKCQMLSELWDSEPRVSWDQNSIRPVHRGVECLHIVEWHTEFQPFHQNAEILHSCSSSDGIGFCVFSNCERETHAYNVRTYIRDFATEVFVLPRLYSKSHVSVLFCLLLVCRQTCSCSLWFNQDPKRKPKTGDCAVATDKELQNKEVR